MGEEPLAEKVDGDHFPEHEAFVELRFGGLEVLQRVRLAVGEDAETSTCERLEAGSVWETFTRRNACGVENFQTPLHSLEY